MKSHLSESQREMCKKYMKTNFSKLIFSNEGRTTLDRSYGLASGESFIEIINHNDMVGEME